MHCLLGCRECWIPHRASTLPAFHPLLQARAAVASSRKSNASRPQASSLNSLPSREPRLRSWAAGWNGATLAVRLSADSPPSPSRSARPAARLALGTAFPVPVRCPSALTMPGACASQGCLRCVEAGPGCGSCEPTLARHRDNNRTCQSSLHACQGVVPTKPADDGAQTSKTLAIRGTGWCFGTLAGQSAERCLPHCEKRGITSQIDCRSQSVFAPVTLWMRPQRTPLASKSARYRSASQIQSRTAVCLRSLVSPGGETQARLCCKCNASHSCECSRVFVTLSETEPIRVTRTCSREKGSLPLSGGSGLCAGKWTESEGCAQQYLHLSG